MINNTTSSTQSLREYIKECMVKLMKYEQQLETDIEEAKKYMRQNIDSKAEEDRNDKHWNADEPEVKRPINSKLAKEKEQQIIEAIEKTKELLGENKGQEEEFEYRPEGLFPPLPKPLTKNEKIAKLHSAYGVSSKGTSSLSKPPVVKKYVKPSESKYTMKTIKPKAIEKNPNKITTPAKPSQRSNSKTGNKPQSASKRGNSCIRRADPTLTTNPQKPLIDKRKVVRRNDSWKDLDNTNPTEEIETNSTQETNHPTTSQPSAHNQTITNQPIEANLARDYMKHIPSPLSNNDIDQAGASPFDTCISKLSSASSISSKHTKLLNMLNEVTTRGKIVADDYMKNIQIENKRSAISSLSQKLIMSYAHQSIAISDMYDEILAKQDLNDDNSRDDEKIPQLDDVYIPADDENIQMIEELLGNTYMNRVVFNDLQNNEEVQKLLSYEDAGYFDKDSEAYQDMVALLSNRGVKTPQGQGLLSDLYTSWYFCERFVGEYSNLSDLRQAIGNLEGMQRIDSNKFSDINRIRSILEPLELNQPLTDSLPTTINNQQDISAIANELLVNYEAKALKTILPTVKQKFNVISHSPSSTNSIEFQKSIVQFLTQLKEADSLVKLNTRLPLIFHTNFPEDV